MEGIQFEVSQEASAVALRAGSADQDLTLKTEADAEVIPKECTE